ncbi:uncharacterized protein JCM6883_006358 [Sporobolomyces salmoneus]|uniref:uncharacterized protein n=1 Tax=Sporobolomyces salmoneus TaxID=183962 RepID=UPI003170A1BB
MNRGTLLVLVLAMSSYGSCWRQPSEVHSTAAEGNHLDKQEECSAKQNVLAAFEPTSHSRLAELARDLHKESTSVLLDFTSRLRKYENARSERQLQETSSAQQHQAALASLLSNLSSMTTLLDAVQRDWEDRMKGVGGELESAASNLRVLPKILEGSLHEIAALHSDRLARVGDDTEAALEKGVQSHEDRLRSASDRFAREAHSTLNSLSTGVAQIRNEITTAELQEAMGSSVALLIGQVNDLGNKQILLSDELDRSLEQSTELAAVLKNLTETARSSQMSLSSSSLDTLLDFAWWFRNLFGK